MRTWRSSSVSKLSRNAAKRSRATALKTATPAATALRRRCRCRTSAVSRRRSDATPPHSISSLSFCRQTRATKFISTHRIDWKLKTPFDRLSPISTRSTRGGPRRASSVCRRCRLPSRPTPSTRTSLPQRENSYGRTSNKILSNAISPRWRKAAVGSLRFCFVFLLFFFFFRS